MDPILWNPILLDYTLAEGQVPMISLNAKSSYLFVYACIIIVSVTSLQVRGRLGSFNPLVHNCISQQLYFLNSLHLFVAVTYWSVHVFLTSENCMYNVQVRAIGLLGYVLISSFLIRENILALVTIKS